MGGDREQHLTDAFVELSGQLVSEFDLVELLYVIADRCSVALDAACAGFLLAGEEGKLHALACPTEQARQLALLQLRSAEGPCLDCFHTGTPILHTDMARGEAAWPGLAAAARSRGLVAMLSVPLRLAGEVVGVLTVLWSSPGHADESAVRTGQVFADMASLAVAQDPGARSAPARVARVEAAVRGDEMVLGATGLFVERMQLEVDEALTMLRGHARGNDRLLCDVAEEILREAGDRIGDTTDAHRDRDKADDG